MVEGEEGGGGSHLSPYVADGCHTWEGVTKTQEDKRGKGERRILGERGEEDGQR